MSLQGIHEWEGLRYKCQKLDIYISLKTEGIYLNNKKGLILGSFPCVTTAYHYVLGYEYGIMDASLYTKGGE